MRINNTPLCHVTKDTTYPCDVTNSQAMLSQPLNSDCMMQLRVLFEDERRLR